jgi:hypothetical protein
MMKVPCSKALAQLVGAPVPLVGRGIDHRERNPWRARRAAKADQPELQIRGSGVSQVWNAPFHRTKVVHHFASTIANESLTVGVDVRGRVRRHVCDLSHGLHTQIRLPRSSLTRSSFAVLPVSREILIRAAGIRARDKLKLPDAIHFATAEIGRCNTFLRTTPD